MDVEGLESVDGVPSPLERFGLSVIRDSGQESGLPMTVTCKCSCWWKANSYFISKSTLAVPELLRTLARISQCKPHWWLASDFKIVSDEHRGDRMLLQIPLRCCHDRQQRGLCWGPSPLGAWVPLKCRSWHWDFCSLSHFSETCSSLVAKSPLLMRNWSLRIYHGSISFQVKKLIFFHSMHLHNLCKTVKKFPVFGFISHELYS